MAQLLVPILALAGAVIAASPAAAEDFGLSAAPAANGGVDGSRSRYSYQVDPGQSLNDEFFVKNTGSSPQAVSVYATDAFNTAAGDFSLLDTGVAPVGAGSWVSFGGTETSFTLQPNEARVIPFTVSVPADAPPGDHAGGMVVSAVTESGQVRLDRRVATRMYLRVSGELQPLLNVSEVSSTYSPSLNPFDGTLDVTFTLSNTGNVALGAKSVVSVSTIFGIPVRPDEKVEIPELLPGTSRSVSLSLTGVGQWVYLGSTIKLAGTVADDAAQPGVLPNLNRDSTAWTVPWALIALLVLGVSLWWSMRLRAARNARRLQEWREYEELQRRENLGGLAEAGA